MKNDLALLKHWFQIFHKQNTPAFFSLIEQGDKDVDLYEVWLATGEKEGPYLFEELQGDELLLKVWDEAIGSYNAPKRLMLSNVKSEQVNGIHYYRGERLHFNGLANLEAQSKWWRLALSRVRRGVTTYKQHRYNQEQHHIDDRMSVLSTVLEIYLEGRSPQVGKTAVANRIHSSLWSNHPESVKILSELELVLNSFFLSGELSKITESSFTPTGKAYATLADHRLQNQRHRENAAIQRGMLIATFFAAVGGIASAVAAFMALK